jgi:hypothetical protein
MRASASSISTCLECFDDVAKVKRIVHPLRKASTIRGVDAAIVVLLLECVAGLAGRSGGWSPGWLGIGRCGNF